MKVWVIFLIIYIFIHVLPKYLQCLSELYIYYFISRSASVIIISVCWLRSLILGKWYEWFYSISNVRDYMKRYALIWVTILYVLYNYINRFQDVEILTKAFLNITNNSISMCTTLINYIILTSFVNHHLIYWVIKKNLF